MRPTSFAALRRWLSRTRSAIARWARLLLSVGYILPIRVRLRHRDPGPFRVLIAGGFGHGNVGDDAMASAVIANLAARAPQDVPLEIVMLSPNPSSTATYHGVPAVSDIDGIDGHPGAPQAARARSRLRQAAFLCAAHARRYGVECRLWGSARDVLDELASADLLFSVGGGYLNSIMPDSLRRKGLLYRAAKILGKPVIASGQTIGPFDTDADRSSARKALNCVDLITLRDAGTSRKRLEECGVEGPRIIDTADDAMTLEPVGHQSARDLLDREVPLEWLEQGTRPIVMMNLKGSLRRFAPSGEKGVIAAVRLMALLADRLVDSYGVRVLFVPTAYGERAGDHALHTEIHAQMANSRLAACVRNEYRPEELKGLVALADFAIGSRYHFCVFAASLCVPFLGVASGLYQQTKLKGLADLCELPECYLPDDLFTTSLETLWPSVDRFVSKGDAVKKQLATIVPSLKERSLIAVEYTCRLMSGTTDRKATMR